MTVYAKPPVLPAWGESNTSAADMVEPGTGALPDGWQAGTAAIQQGWPQTATPPPRQYFNWFFNLVSSALRYFMQRGLPDYDAAETYSINSRIIGNDGKTYVSLIANNIGNAPSTSPAAWQRWGYTATDLQVYAPLASPALSGNPTAPTQAAADSSTKLATTAFVATAIANVKAWVNAQVFATQAWVTAQLAAFATIASLTVGFDIHLAATGHIKFPTWLGGLIVNWAIGTQDPSGTSEPTQTVYWDLDFPTACLWAGVSTTIQNASSTADMWYQVIGNPGLASIRLQRQQPSTSNNQITWPTVIAIGY